MARARRLPAFPPWAFLVWLVGPSGGGSDAAPVPPATAVAPPAPAWLAAVPADGSVTLDWASVPGAVSYVVYAAEAPGVGRSSYATLPGGRRIPVGRPPQAV